jgi:hypothetical protein
VLGGQPAFLLHWVASPDLTFQLRSPSAGRCLPVRTRYSDTNSTVIGDFMEEGPPTKRSRLEPAKDNPFDEACRKNANDLLTWFFPAWAGHAG